jgi:hypothetical protein
MWTAAKIVVLIDMALFAWLLCKLPGERDKHEHD